MFYISKDLARKTIEAYGLAEKFGNGKTTVAEFNGLELSIDIDGGDGYRLTCECTSAKVGLWHVGYTGSDECFLLKTFPTRESWKPLFKEAQ